jgi:hypothetical protein
VHINQFFAPSKTQLYASQTNLRIARLCAVDGLSFNVVAKSYDLHRIDSNLPNSPNTVREKVEIVSTKVKNDIRQDVAKLKAKGIYFYNSQ